LGRLVQTSEAIHVPLDPCRFGFVVLGIEGDVEGWTVGKIRYTAITESGHFSHWHLSLLWAKADLRHGRPF